MQLFIISLLAAAGVGFLIWAILQWRYYETPPQGVIHYSSKQLDILTDLGKTSIPVLVGFAVLAVSGAGFLFKDPHLHTDWIQFWTFVVFALLVISLGLWIHVLESMVDCAAVFDPAPEEIADAITLERIRFLNRAWKIGATCARAGTVCFFEAVDIALIITLLVFGGPAQR